MKIKIKNKIISNNSKPFIIAEISANHRNSIHETIKLLKAAAKIKVDAVKFQTFDLDEMTLDIKKKDFLIKKKFKIDSWNNRSLYSIYKEAQFPFKWHKKIFNVAKKLGLICFSSVFDEKSLDFLETLQVPMYKIASLESLHFPLIEKVAKTKKPVIISTGTLSKKEIQKLIFFLKKIKCKKFIILHCVTEYPAKYENVKLKTIQYIKNKYKCLTGYSDHTNGIGVSISSVNYGACVVEKHLMLSKNKKSLDSSFSSDILEMKKLVEEINNSWKAIGNNKINISKSEKKYLKYRRSIYAVKDVNKGSRLSKENIKVIRPGLGLQPEHYNKIINKRAKIFIRRGTALNKKLISN
jgi:pseudaminic acid synthase